MRALVSTGSVTTLIGLCALALACTRAGNDSKQLPVHSAVREPAAAAPHASGSPPTQSMARATPKPAELAEPISEENLKSAVSDVAKPRAPGSAHWRRVQAACADRFEAAGFTVEKHRYTTGTNVVGSKAGARTPTEQVVVSAHYDHIPGCQGADDNASGVAAVWEIARVLGSAQNDRSLIVACWDEEERGLRGSLAYAERAHARGERIIAAFSLDGVGFASSAPNSQRIPLGFDTLFPEQAASLKARGAAADFIAVVGNGASTSIIDSVERSANASGLPIVGLELSSLQSLLLRDAYRSDHASFWLEGYPAVLVTDTANFRNPTYHCQGGPDRASTLDYAFLGRVTETVARSARELSLQ